MDSFELVTVLPATPEQVYAAWLDGELHTAFTGHPATGTPELGGSFSAWDGYIVGTNLELTPGARIVQSWRTSEFAESDGDSRLELVFERVDNGTRVTLRHSEIPAGQGVRYHGGWQEHYFAPMLEYFTRSARKAPSRRAPSRKAPARKAPARKPVKRRSAASKKAPAKKVAARKPSRKAATRKPAARRRAKK